MKSVDSKLIPTAVFDVCDTLYYSNTTHDFVRCVVEKMPISPATVVYRLLNNRWSPLRYLFVALGVATGWDGLKKYNVSVLTGMKSEEIAAHATCFVEQFLDQRKIIQTHDLIEKFKKDGLRVVLCSSSIDPIVAAVARDLGIEDFVGTSLKFEGDTFTGAISNETTGRKLAILNTKDLIGSLEYAASDNLSDLSLLVASKNAIAVTHRRKNEAFWKSRDFKIIDLDI
ncbi:MAG: HAD-IB family phosphatase [Acidobacteriota bacterium]